MMSLSKDSRCMLSTCFLIIIFDFARLSRCMDDLRRTSDYNYLASAPYLWEPQYDCSQAGSSSDAFLPSSTCYDSNGFYIGEDGPMFYDYKPPSETKEACTLSTEDTYQHDRDEESNGFDVMTSEEGELHIVSAVPNKKFEFRDSRSRKFNFIRKRMSRHLESPQQLKLLIENQDAEACALNEAYMADQRKRFHKCSLKKKMDKDGEDEEVKRRIKMLEMLDHDPQGPFEEDKYPASPMKKQRVRDIYRKLQKDIVRYNSTQKLKRPYSITMRQINTKKDHAAKVQLGQDVQYAIGDADADEMIERMQNTRVIFASDPESAEVLSFLYELDEWLRRRRYKYPPIEKPVIE